MPLREPSTQDQYPHWIGLIFVFNLIVGTGALTLPADIAKAGWLFGIFFIVVLAFISYMTVTFVIETMACANAVIHWRRLQIIKRENGPSSRSNEEDESDDHQTDNLLVSDESIEHTPLFSQSSRYYGLDNKIEMGEMACIFFNDFGRILFFLCLAIYLYGDLSIYSAVVAKTLRDVVCSRNESFANITDDEMENDPCWPNHTITRLDCYRLSLVSFIMLLGPFTFFNVQKTKYIQLCTLVFRWLAFTVMISIAVHRIFANGQQGYPPMADPMGFPALFGACIYSFMCHHSLPSIIFPMNDKSRVRSLISLDYLLIGVFYLCLALTGAFAFETLQDVYTLNFVPSPDQKSKILNFIGYFLSLFPVFTLSASFPIIAITLRNNLQTLFIDTTRIESYHYFFRKILFPIMTIVPPTVVTYYTDNVKSLVSFTGSYAGTGIQYIIPICLVFSARRTCKQLLGQGIVNEFRSPFRSDLWLLAVFLWSLACVIFVTVNFFVSQT